LRHDQLGRRSRRPWRTLFERTLGSLPYGAVLSLAGENGENIPASTATAAAGKVVWASEGFEKLAGVDAIDVVGQEVGSLFDVGGTEEGEEGEEAGELKRSLELGQASFGCTLWMTMGEQQDGLTNVLCVHQPVTVPPQLSEEGRYSVLLFFDTASERKGESLRGDLLLESGIVDEQQHGASHVEGHRTLSGQLENGRGSRSGDDEEEQGRTSGNIRRIQQHRQQQTQSFPAFSEATESGGAAEYSSGDESSTEPRDDLLGSPGREEATAAATASPAEPELFDGGDERIDGESNSNVNHGDLSNGGGNSIFDRGLLSPSSRPPVAGSRISLDRTQESEEEAGTEATTVQREGSDDPYEDDFCCDEEDESLSLSLSPPEQEQGRITGKNISSDNTINHGPDNGGGRGKAVAGGHRGVDDGLDVKGHWQDDKDDAYSSSSSDGVYSGTVAGGLQINLHGGSVDGVESERDDNDELTWEGSPEGSSAHHSYHNPCQEGQEINVDGDVTGLSAVTDFRGGADGSSATDGVSQRDKPP
ncbi:unnamed protein product, partial [Ectocarpus sp. 8 AP-2014]